MLRKASGSDWEGIINVGGVDLYVSRLGKGPELIIVHDGLDWDHTYLRAFMNSQVEARNLVFFDLRGCGRSQRFDDYALLHIRHVVEDIRNLAIHFDLDKADFQTKNILLIRVQIGAPLREKIMV